MVHRASLIAERLESWNAGKLIGSQAREFVSADPTQSGSGEPGPMLHALCPMYMPQPLSSRLSIPPSYLLTLSPSHLPAFLAFQPHSFPAFQPSDLLTFLSSISCPFLYELSADAPASYPASSSSFLNLRSNSAFFNSNSLVTFSSSLNSSSIAA